MRYVKLRTDRLTIQVHDRTRYDRTGSYRQAAGDRAFIATRDHTGGIVTRSLRPEPREERQQLG